MRITLQEYFNKTAIDLVTRTNGRSVSNVSCVYLDKDGNKCAVGIHIPEGHPAQTFLGDVFMLHVQHPDLEGIAYPSGSDGLELAVELQRCHDFALNWDYLGRGGGWRLNERGLYRLDQIAKDFGLTMPEGLSLRDRPGEVKR